MLRFPDNLIDSVAQPYLTTAEFGTGLEFALDNKTLRLTQKVAILPQLGIQSRHRSFAPQDAPARTLAEITEAAEQAGIKSALIANDHHRELTAKSLGISVRTLHYKMSKYGLH